jgi:DNA-binding MarR family transcriptional regulator
MPPKKSPRAFYMVRRLQQLVGERLEEALVPLEITANQYTVLSMVRLASPVTSAELARRLRVTAQSNGASVKALVAKELVVRHGIEANKRMLMLKLTPQGIHMLKLADRVVLKAEAEFFAPLSAKERQLWDDCIVRLRSAAMGR